MLSISSWSQLRTTELPSFLRLKRNRWFDRKFNTSIPSLVHFAKQNPGTNAICFFFPEKRTISPLTSGYLQILWTSPQYLDSTSRILACLTFLRSRTTLLASFPEDMHLLRLPRFHRFTGGGNLQPPIRNMLKISYTRSESHGVHLTPILVNRLGCKLIQ